jgi:sialic acid synthase SpsE
MGVALLKNGSDYLGHLPLIEEMAASGVRTILSTGMGQEEEISDAVEAFRSAGGSDLVLLHCTSLYPTPVERANVNRITQLKEHGTEVGYSDHTRSYLAAQLAVALGATVIEKHFTLDHSLHGPDHLFSVSPAELREYIDAIRLAETAITDRSGREEELANKRMFTLSCAAAKSLAKGDSINKEDILFIRPGTGIRPREIPRLIGRTLLRDVNRGELFDWRDFD